MEFIYTVNGDPCVFHGSNREFGDWIAGLTGDIEIVEWPEEVQAIEPSDLAVDGNGNGAEFFLVLGAGLELRRKSLCGWFSREAWAKVSVHKPWTDEGIRDFIRWYLACWRLEMK